MTRTHRWLSALVVLQLGLVAVTWAPPSGDAHPATTLVDWSADEVVSLTVKSDGQRVELSRASGQWVLVSEHDYPASERRVAETLDRLLGLEVQAPIATQPANHGSLNVSDDANARRVTLGRGNETVDLILGAASGSAVHVRRADRPEVYALRGWTAFAIGDQPNRYWDTRLLDVNAEAMDSLTIHNPASSFTLEKNPEGWHLAGEDGPLDQQVVGQWVNRLANLRVAGVTGPIGPAPLEGSTHVSWTAMEGSRSLSGGLTFGATAAHRTALQLDGGAYLLTVSSSSAEPFSSVNPDDLGPATP